MLVKSISKNVLEKIKSAGIKPRPKWQFLLKDYLIWIFFGLTIFIGSMATSVIIYMVRNNNWDLYGRLGHLFFLKTLPYFWIAILVIFVLLAYYNFKLTKGGYRYRFYIIILVAVIISFLLGTIFYTVGFAKRVEMRMQKSVPLYHKVFIKGVAEKGYLDLLKPGKGLVAGTVTDRDDSGFVMEDFSGKVWNILSEDAESRGPIEIEEGIELMVVGEMINETTYMAQQIRPWFNPDLTRHKPFMKEKPFFPRTK